MLQNTGELLVCPTCGQRQIDRVDDYVRPAVIGSASRAVDNCDHCCKPFAVERTSMTTFSVASLSRSVIHK